MTEADALKQFGLPSTGAHRAAIRSALVGAMPHPWDEHELIKCLAVQLFTIGSAEDSIIIWQAKRLTMDLGCSIDVQLLCGAGVDATRSYLSASNGEHAIQALHYLENSIACGDFDGFSVADWISSYRDYYEPDNSPS